MNHAALGRRAALALPALLPSLFWARPAAALVLPERITQGMMVIGRAPRGTRAAAFDGRAIRVSPEGVLVFGTARDAGPEATITLTNAEGRPEARRVAVQPRHWDIQRLNGLPDRFVSPNADALARIRAEQERLNAARRTDTAIPHFAEGFAWPATGRISGIYGSQRILNGQARAPHLGLDVAVPTGTPLVACAAGRVTLAEDLYFTGNTILIEHGHGITTFYAHMSRMDVRVGQEVGRAQPIGLSGATGRVTGPHLHLALFWFGTALDPHPALPGGLTDGWR